MKKIIDGVEITLTEEHIALLTQGKYAEVFAYHNTTKEEFDKVHSGLSPRLYNMALLELIVAMYNKGESLDWDDENQSKYYPYFRMGRPFSLPYVDFFYSSSHVPPPFVFKNYDDANQAVEKYFDVYKAIYA